MFVIELVSRLACNSREYTTPHAFHSTFLACVVVDRIGEEPRGLTKDFLSIQLIPVNTHTFFSCKRYGLLL